jgi:hypothetical protein
LSQWLYSALAEAGLPAICVRCASTSDIELSRYGNGIIASDAEVFV